MPERRFAVLRADIGQIADGGWRAINWLEDMELDGTLHGPIEVVVGAPRDVPVLWEDTSR